MQLTWQKQNLPHPPTHPPPATLSPPGLCHQKQDDCRVSLWRVEESCPDTWRHSDRPSAHLVSSSTWVCLCRGGTCGDPEAPPPPQTHCSSFANFSHEGCESSLLLGLYQFATSRVQNRCGGTGGAICLFAYLFGDTGLT